VTMSGDVKPEVKNDGRGRLGHERSFTCARRAPV
jgi:hypothetical protein